MWTAEVDSSDRYTFNSPVNSIYHVTDWWVCDFLYSAGDGWSIKLIQIWTVWCHVSFKRHFAYSPVITNSLSVVDMNSWRRGNKMFHTCVCAAEEQARNRFQSELEFIQCLANPNYLNCEWQQLHCFYTCLVWLLWVYDTCFHHQKVFFHIVLMELAVSLFSASFYVEYHFIQRNLLYHIVVSICPLITARLQSSSLKTSLEIINQLWHLNI